MRATTRAASLAAALTIGLCLANTIAAKGVITLAPNATEMVYAAGGGAQMAATVTASDFPAAAAALPRVGDGITLNLERIVMLRPTLVVGWLRSGAALQVEALAQTLNATVMYTRPLALRDIASDIRRLGAALGTEETASRAADAVNARIDALEARFVGREPVSVFVEVGHTPLYTIGADPLLNDAMRVCGAVNIYGDTGIPAPRVSIESVLVHAPQLVIAPGTTQEDTDAVRKRWAAYGLAAAIEGRIYGVDPDALFRPGPRFVDAAESLCEAVDAVRQANPAGAGSSR